MKLLIDSYTYKSLGGSSALLRCLQKTTKKQKGAGEEEEEIGRKWENE